MLQKRFLVLLAIFFLLSHALIGLVAVDLAMGRMTSSDEYKQGFEDGYKRGLQLKGITNPFAVGETVYARSDYDRPNAVGVVTAVARDMILVRGKDGDTPFDEWSDNSWWSSLPGQR